MTDIIEVIDNQLMGPAGADGVGVIAGGAFEQVLAKASSGDFDTKWLSLTKTLVGLSACDNTSDVNKPISLATQTALDLKANLVYGKVPTNQLPAFTYLVLGETIVDAYRGDRGKFAYDHSQIIEGNPHMVTKAEVGLGNCNNTSDLAKPISTAAQSLFNLKADLVNGVVPPTQLSQLYIVSDYTNVAAFPATGTNRTYYKALDTELIYLWGGSTYTSVSGTLGLGTSSTSAYRGDCGLIAYNHTFVVSGNPHAVTKAEVGLGNCNNTADVDKPVSSLTQAAIDLRAPTADPTFTGTLNVEVIRFTGITEARSMSIDANGYIVSAPYPP